MQTIEARIEGSEMALEPSSPQRPDPPPLRIHHLMVCAVVAAVMLSLSRFLLSLYPQQSFYGTGVFAFGQILDSIGLTLTGFSIYWWRKGYASFSEPGQMLLIPYAATLWFFFSSIAFALAASRLDGGLGVSSWYSSISVIIGIGGLLISFLLPIGFYCWCAWKIADTWPWRILFVACALGAALTSTLAMMIAQRVIDVGPNNIDIVFVLPQLIQGVMLVAAGLLAVITDLTARRARSWTHWAGIILWLIGQIGSLLMGLYYMFIWQMA